MKKNVEEYCSSFLNIIKSGKLDAKLFEGNFGIERENVRVDSKGAIAGTEHPESFGNKLENPYITVDFAESQVELITPILNSIPEAHGFLKNLHDIVSLELKDEYLWPQSTPPNIIDEDHIAVAKFDNDKSGKHAEEYREHLENTYGKAKQVLSGIHFNFSFSDDFLKELHSLYDSSISFKDFKNEVYLKVARNYTRYCWLIIYLLGASPSVHETYSDKAKERLKKIKDAYFLEGGVSYRLSDNGYKNIEDIFVPLNSTESYIETINSLIDDGIISDGREYYSPIRLKAKDNSNLLESLDKDGIEYLEIRTIDLNPYTCVGIEINDVYFLHAFLIFCLLRKCKTDGDCIFTREDNSNSNFNQEMIAARGQDHNLIMKDKDSLRDAKEWAVEIIDEIKQVLGILGFRKKEYFDSIDFEMEKVLDASKSYSLMLTEDIKKDSFINFHLNKAKKYRECSEKNEFKFRGYEGLELSTQILIKAAVKKGIKFNILDKADNFIRLSRNGKTELVKQATKTSKDSYVNIEAMDNKVVTKVLLDEKGIRTPFGINFTEKDKALECCCKFRNDQIVIKPKAENFGVGITIFKDQYSMSEYQTAINLAFQNGGPIIVEEFISGEEFRFFIIDDELLGILRRVPANVMGDGVHSIEELVEIKNLDPLRGVGYKTPLEKIKLGVTEKMFLGLQDKDIYYVPGKDETVFLRENSNISTGGDSLDYTDIIPQAYKDIALKASKALGVKISGVDMIIKNIENEKPTDNDYAVIEVNFNPAIHIHTYPYKGKRRDIANKILDLLGF
ncbi:MAG TPA: bifunctional glutamate--cysteine ligase GshA/glutathione synthetase GshB [Victivallales bacterium]|nr:bifunctional glutamate--cysteine ligase GshA/glutathione synthetase GshB [Victivallales bacterium]